MMTAVDASGLLIVLVLSVVLLLVHVGLQGSLATKELGSDWNAGPRDDSKAPHGVLAGRAARASGNYRETYAGFVGLLLGLAIAGDASGWGMLGAWVWLIARVVYLPLYLGGIPYIRSLVWLVAMLGLVIMAGALVL